MDWPTPCKRQAGKSSQSRKGAIAAPERHPLPNCKQASLLTKSSWDSGRSTYARRVAARDQLPRRDTRHTCEGVPVVQAAGTGEVISCSDHPRQAPGHLSGSDLGRVQNAVPTESAPLRTTRVPEPECLRPGKCIQPRAGLRQFPAEQPRA